MKREYKLNIADFPIFMVEINDPPYYSEDLYELIGSKGYVVTFTFRQDTDTAKRYGESITGSIFYPKGTKQQIEKCIKENALYADTNVRLSIILPRLNQLDIDELKYKGFPIDHIQYLHFVPFEREPETESGLKVVPNIIKIPVSTANFNVDHEIFIQNVIFRKLKQGTELIPEEKAYLVGSILAMDQNQIDPDLLTVLGYTTDSAGNDRRIWYNYYQTKRRRRILSEIEVQKLKKVEDEDISDKMTLLARELATGHVPGEALTLKNEQISLIMDSLKRFQPRVLIPIRRQIWWDTKSYLHIIIRHARDLQIGKINKEKTPFPYAFEELELLIEKVIDSIIGEIKAHFDKSKTPGSFYRSGKMSVQYNGDYYSFHIAENGLLENMHIVEE